MGLADLLAGQVRNPDACPVACLDLNDEDRAALDAAFVTLSASAIYRALKANSTTIARYLIEDHKYGRCSCGTR